MRRWFVACAALALVWIGLPAQAQMPSTAVPPLSACHFTGMDHQEPTNWFKSGNWDCGHVPNKNTTVVIDAYVRAYPYHTNNPFDPCFRLLGWCTAEADDVFVLSNGEFSSDRAEISGALHLQGGILLCEVPTAKATNCQSQSGVFDMGVLDWESGDVYARVSARTVEWHSGFLHSRISAYRVNLYGEGQTRIYGDQGGRLYASVLRFVTSSSTAQPAAFELYGDGVVAGGGVVEFERNGTVEGWAGEPIWDVGSLKVPPDIDARTWDIALRADSIGIRPGGRLLMSGGSLRPTLDSPVLEQGVTGKRSFLGCNIQSSVCQTPSAPAQDEAGRLETGVAPEGSANLLATKVYVPEHWAMKDVVWAHWSGDVSADDSVPSTGKGTIEPLNPRPTSATNAWFEWYGGHIDRVAFSGGGTARPDYGVDIDILGGSSDALRLKRLTIGSDAALSVLEPLYVDCGGTLTVSATGSMSQYPGTYLGGCDDESLVANYGTWSVLSGTARLAESRFLSAGDMDLRSGSLEVSDLVAANIRGTMTFSWDTQGQLIDLDQSPITLGSPTSYLTTMVDSLPPGPVEDDYFNAILDASRSSVVQGFVLAGRPNIQPGLLWSSRLDSSGLIVEAVAGKTVATRVSGCPWSPCATTVKKDRPFEVSWFISPSSVMPGMGLDVTLPAQMRLLSSTGMSCNGTRTLTCSLGSVQPLAQKKVTLRLITPRVGRGTITGVVSGQGLVGDRSLEPVTVVARS